MKKVRLIFFKGLRWIFPLFASLFFFGCVPAPSLPTPPENYRGPMAEGPVVQPGDYWVYQRGDGSKIKRGAGIMLSHVAFPLWLGKRWTDDGEARMVDQPDTTKAFRTPVRIECTATQWQRIVVLAGTFESFECKCQCKTLLPQYAPDCGSWTVWYAAEAKNIIKMKTESTANSFELVEYKVSGKVSAEQRKVEDEKAKLGQADKAEIPAKVIRTVPADGSDNVPTSLKEIVIVFDQPMGGAWNLGCSPSFYPNTPAGRTCTEGGPYWRDDRTFVIPLTAGLKPNQRYSFTINSSVGLEKYDLGRAFRGLSQPKPVLPQRFFFTTGQ